MDRCSQCGSTEGPFVVQHLSHPPDMKRIEKEVAFKLGLPEGSYEVLREAQRIADIEKEKYISFQEAVTFCDKCAFMWDMNEMKLCAKCGKNYHSFKYTQCKECYNKEIYGEDLFGGQS